MRNMGECTGVWQRIDDENGPVLHNNRPQFHKKYRRPKSDPLREQYKVLRWSVERGQWQIVRVNLDVLAYCACDVSHPLDIPPKSTFFHLKFLMV